MNRCLSSILIFLILLPLLVFAVPSEKLVREDYTIYHYSKNVSRLDITIGWRPYTVTIVHGDEGVLLIDTGIFFDGDIIEEAIKEITEEPIKKVILTHSHPDHAGGIARFGKNAEIYANHKGEWQKFYSLPPLKTYPYPVNFVTDSLSFSFNNEEIHLYNLPPGHKRDDLYVHIEKANLIVTGDLILSGGYPFAELADEGSYKVILEDFRYFLSRYPTATYIAGHGWDMDYVMLSNYLKITEENVAFIKDKLQTMTVDELLASNEMAVYDSLADFGVSHALWVDIIAKEEGFIEAGDHSILGPLTQTIVEKGTESIEETFNSLKAGKENLYHINEAELNLLGYQLITRNRLADAEVIFRLNTQEFPASANTYDSYGELMLMMGDTLKGIEYYRTAIETDSTFENAARVLEKLGVE